MLLPWTFAGDFTDNYDHSKWLLPYLYRGWLPLQVYNKLLHLNLYRRLYRQVWSRYNSYFHTWTGADSHCRCTTCCYTWTCAGAQHVNIFMATVWVDHPMMHCPSLVWVWCWMYRSFIYYTAWNLAREIQKQGEYLSYRCPDKLMHLLWQSSGVALCSFCHDNSVSGSWSRWMIRGSYGVKWRFAVWEMLSCRLVVAVSPTDNAGCTVHCGLLYAWGRVLSHLKWWSCLGGGASPRASSKVPAPPRHPAHGSQLLTAFNCVKLHLTH